MSAISSYSVPTLSHIGHTQLSWALPGVCVCVVEQQWNVSQLDTIMWCVLAMSSQSPLTYSVPGDRCVLLCS